MAHTSGPDAAKKIMSPPSAVREWDSRDILALIREFPLATISSPSWPDSLPLFLPLLAHADGKGHIIRLEGHLARRRFPPADLQAPYSVRALFCGPQAYVSPHVVTNRNWIPTWNYARAELRGILRFHEEQTWQSVQDLVHVMEKAQPDPWTLDEAGERAARLAQHIVAFTIEVDGIDAAFKLGQDETPEIFSEIVANHPDRTLARWMQRFRNDQSA